MNTKPLFICRRDTEDTAFVIQERGPSLARSGSDGKTGQDKFERARQLVAAADGDRPRSFGRGVSRAMTEVGPKLGAAPRGQLCLKEQR